MNLEQNLLDDLDDRQREVATTFPGPICVMAGAGTGKTRAITYRIAYAVQQGFYRAENVLALTFTNKAAFEMQERLAKLGITKVQARTFHAAALRQLTHFWAEEMGYDLPRILENKANIMTIVANNLSLKLDGAAIRDLSAEIEWAKVSIIPSSEYAQTVTELGRTIPYVKTAQEMQSIFEMYEKVKTNMGVIDFEDVLILLIGLFKTYPYILQEVHKQYRYFIVDEFQDVSLLQQTLLDLWVKNPSNLCVVGDTAQTIYSFAGADPSFLVNFSTKYENTKKIVLDKNYRSGKQIIALANSVIAEAKYKKNKLPSVMLYPNKESDNFVEYNTYFDEANEAENTVAQIRQLLAKNINPSSIAILYRTNAQSQYFENYLSDSEIPYIIKNGTKFFSRPEIREAIKMMKKVVLVTPKEQATVVIDNVLSMLGWRVDSTNLTGSSKEKWDNLNVLRNLAIKEKNIYVHIEQFYNYLVTRMQSQTELEKEGVVLSSLHSCKGLEWDYVFLVGMQEGIMPISLAKTDDQIEEERRLLYVGITRAREKLYISNYLSRQKSIRNTNSASDKNITRFLLKHWNEELSKTTTFKKEKRLEKDSGVLGEYGESTQYIYKLLSDWRDYISQEESIPKDKIIKESALIAIAVAKPKTIKHLEIIRGVTKTFIYNHGSEILRLIRDNT
ncbi:ATP-dependent DNA helicase UvrD2 [Actinomyces sp. zg-332]|uniref:ATP-dependent helicase n=1 Tax=Actinomyces sp. zg-332 TaxID=2708340 RepID=UPI00141F545E|nr:ATP-dependent DNA helicase UvrD2 [Actinomyces sp. zg-332]QPK94591.1 ATP-dependent DNA helicase UvrD2 [Actinomyces sp. zg-332]